MTETLVEEEVQISEFYKYQKVHAQNLDGTLVLGSDKKPKVFTIRYLTTFNVYVFQVGVFFSLEGEAIAPIENRNWYKKRLVPVVTTD